MSAPKSPVDRIVRRQRIFLRLMFPSTTRTGRELSPASKQRALRACFSSTRAGVQS